MIGKVHNFVMKNVKTIREKQGVQVDDLYAFVVLVPSNTVGIEGLRGGIFCGDACGLITQHHDECGERNGILNGGGLTFDFHDEITAAVQCNLRGFADAVEIVAMGSFV